MFTEPALYGGRRGWIEVICGPMFSGKTEELIRRLRRAQIAHQKAEIFKPSIDTRYHIQNIVSHNDNTIPSTPVDHSQAILLMGSGVSVIGIDEAQFFDDMLTDVCNQLALNGSRVIVAGLDMDFSGKPFGQIPCLLATADYITKLHAICVCCGNIASYSYRKTSQEAQVVLGEKDSYEPRCRYCYYLGNKV